MFCPKCGNQLPDGSRFCASCGEQLTPSAAAQSAPAKAKPLNVVACIEAFFALLCFIFGFLPLFKVTQTFSSGKGGSQSYSLLSGIGQERVSVFNINALMGIAKILLIIQIVIFVVYIVTRVIDLNKYLNLSVDLKKLMPRLYFCFYGAALVFTLIGTLVGYTGAMGALNGVASFRPAVCWYIAVALLFCFGIAVVKPNVFSGLIKQQ